MKRSFMFYQDDPKWALGKRPFLCIDCNHEEAHEIAQYLETHGRVPYTKGRTISYDSIPCFESKSAFFEKLDEIKAMEKERMVNEGATFLAVSSFIR